MTYTDDRDVVRLTGVRKVHEGEGRPVVALDGVDLAIAAGTFTAVMGPSGSGKSTLLQVAAGLERPTAGTVEVGGRAMTGEDETALTKLRRQRIGFVFQHFNLLPTLTVLQNVALPLRLAGRPADLERCRALLRRLGLGELADRRPAELSGGQQQRAALARAMVTRPAVILADEPTGALDSRSAREVLGLLWEAVHQLDQTVVMVTHDPVAASYADTVLFLADGRLAGLLEQPTAEDVAARMTHLGEAA